MNITFVIVSNYELTQKGSSGVACIKILPHDVSDEAIPNQNQVDIYLCIAWQISFLIVVFKCWGI